MEECLLGHDPHLRLRFLSESQLTLVRFDGGLQHESSDSFFYRLLQILSVEQDEDSLLRMCRHIRLALLTEEPVGRGVGRGEVMVVVVVVVGSWSWSGSWEGRKTGEERGGQVVLGEVVCSCCLLQLQQKLPVHPFEEM